MSCSRLNWSDKYEQFKILVISTVADGNCLFHALVKACLQVNDPTEVTKFRKELAYRLGSPSKIDPSKTNYEIINKGNTPEFAKWVPEFSLEHMQTELNSTCAIGYGYMEYISDQLDKDIYILDAQQRSVYITDENCIKLRDSIVLYYTSGHYDLIALQRDCGHLVYLFHPQDPFVVMLRQDLNRISNQ